MKLKRLIPVLLALSMVLAFAPIAAQANDAPQPPLTEANAPALGEGLRSNGTGKVTGASFMALTRPEFRFYTAGLNEQTAYNYNQAGITAAYADPAVSGTPNARFVKKADGSILLEVTGLAAETMAEEVVVTIPGLGEIRFNGNAFAKAMAAGSDPATRALGAALYNYGTAAKACFSPAAQPDEP